MIWLQVHLAGSKLQIDQEGRSRKFTKKVQQKTFAGSSANGRAIMYVTERAVFKLVEGKGLELVEIAPGTRLHLLWPLMSYVNSFAAALAISYLSVGQYLLCLCAKDSHFTAIRNHRHLA